MNCLTVEKCFSPFPQTMTKTVYGDIPLAQQRIGFGQLTWDKKLNKHDYFFELPCAISNTITHPRKPKT
jgi:hypothetical protein